MLTEGLSDIRKALNNWFLQSKLRAKVISIQNHITVLKSLWESGIPFCRLPWGSKKEIYICLFKGNMYQIKYWISQYSGMLTI